MSPRSKPASCISCSINSHGTDFSAVEGTGSSGVMFVGEGSGEHEQRDQLPFRQYAPAGAVLERCLRRMGLDRKQFAITNVVRCRPRKNWLEGAPWEYSAIRQCRPNLDAAISQFRPRCIVALGGVALRELTGEAGEARGVTHLAGYVLPRLRSEVGEVTLLSRSEGSTAEQALPVIADFHPSYLRRGKASHQGVFSRILQRALAIASGRDRQYVWGVDPDDPATWQQPAWSWPPRTEKVEKWCSCVELSQDHDPVIWAKCPICKGTGRIHEDRIIPGGSQPGTRLQYWTHPTLDQARSVLGYLRDNSRLPIAKDIETSESSSLDEDAREGFSDTEVRLFQLSYQSGTGIALPYEGEFRQVIRDLLHLPNPAYGHNWDNFDHKVLRAAAAREGWTYAPPVRVFDTLDMFHHWQPDLPAHLQFCASFINFPFPWKHLAATNIEFYGICDVDADLQLGLYLEKALKKDNLWGEGDAYSVTTGYTGQERELRPVLAAMEDRGMPIDDERRITLGEDFRIAAIEIAEGKTENGVRIPGLMERFPESAKKLDPYKTFPPELKKLPESDWGKLFREPDKWRCKCGRENKMQAQTCGNCTRLQEDGKLKAGKWYRYGQREVDMPSVDDAGEPCTVREVHWCYIPEFNPNSGKQLIEYMKAVGHKVPKSKEEDVDGNQKDTTAAKELQRLAVKTGDDFYLKVIEYRGLTKLRGTYVDGFAPARDGRVHTTFTFSTAIGQLSSRNPNTQNFTKLKPTPALAKAMRAMVAADEGCLLTEIDFKSCHVITLGHLAGDANYTRLGRLDIHSFVAGHFLQLWDGQEIFKETDDELLQRFKWLKSDPERKRVRDDQAKHGILGIGNGLRAKGLYERYMESFPARQCPICGGAKRVLGVRGLKNCPTCAGSGLQSGLSIAEEVLKTCERLFPRVFEYQEAQRREAHERQCLRTPYGHQRRFYEVYRWDSRKGCWSHGDQAEEAVAYRLANVAHAHMREVMKELDRRGLMAKYGCFNQIHDSLMFHHREEQAEDILREVLPVMTADSQVMPGLWLGAEASQGRRWSDMREVTLPTLATAPASVLA